MTKRCPGRWHGPAGAAAAVGGLVTWALAGASWACVPQPLLSVTPQASGKPGSEVTVGALAVPGAAEVRWNALDGPLLAKATGPDFSVPVTIPQVPEGLYALIVVGRGADASVAATGRAAFLVTSVDERATGPTPASNATAPSMERVSSDTASPVLLTAGGAGLVVLGGLAGSAVSGRRRRAPSAEAPPRPPDEVVKADEGQPVPDGPDS